MKKNIFGLILLYFIVHNCGGGSTGASSSFQESRNAPIIENNSSINCDNNDTKTDVLVYCVGENEKTAFEINATDRSDVVYSLSGGDFAMLTVDPVTGKVSFLQNTDFKSKNIYRFNIVVTDSLGNRTVQAVIIKVRDIKNINMPLSGIDESEYFIITWKTTTNNKEIYIGAASKCHVDWGDGTSSKNITGNVVHTYNKVGTYTVKVSADSLTLYFTEYAYNTFTENTKLLSIEQWGSIKWTTMANAFLGCSKMIINASDKPNLSNVTNMYRMFAGTSSFNQDIGDWDVSSVTDMDRMFYKSLRFNQDISDWDVSNVTNMDSMFTFSSKFNQDISDWDVSNVTNMYGMFSFSSKFNQNLNNWDIAKTTDTRAMFIGAISLETLPSWYKQ